MPYISKEDRSKFRDLEDLKIDSVGELNYCFTRLALKFFNKGKNYQAINDVLGALEGAKQEFYRRVAQNYEIVKCQIHGDVYG